MKLIVTEKTSVAMQFAKTLGVKNRSNGYISNDEWTITWCVGHLVTMSYPEKYNEKYKQWNLADLPFLPKEYLYEVIKDVKDQYKIVEGLLKKADVIYNAGDSGREGEAIQRLVYEMAGVEGRKKILRVWIDSQTDDEIRRGIKQAKPESEYDNLAKSAKMRAIEDYAIGINLSRALSCKFGYEFNKEIESKKYIPIAVGRVMTCVLGMIVKRELEIMTFEPTDYYKIDSFQSGFKAHWKAVDDSKYKGLDLLYNETGFKERAEAEKLLNILKNDPRLTVSKLEKKDEQKKAPLLYNLAELQADCSKKFKISPDETLEIVQSLYENKFTTYPRTDARVISTAVAKEIDNNLKAAACTEETKALMSEIISNNWQRGIEKTKYCDDSKITDHYAIIPTGEVPDLDSLSELERDVYMLILKRFLAIFFPAAVYAKTSAVLKHSCGENFYITKKVLTSEGYLKVSGRTDTVKDKKDDDDEDGDDGELASIKQGDVLDASFEIITSTTQPPKRYTSGSMILAMENAGNLIEDEELRAQIKGAGIGTSATRAEVIKKLVKNKYIECNNKTQVLKPTFIGSALYEIVEDNVPALLSPEMTASWEKGLSGIEQGSVTPETYEKKLNAFIIKSVDIIKSKTAEERPQAQREVAGTCPVCGNDLYETEKGYFCSQRRKDKKTCQFAFPKMIGGRPLPQEQVDKLLRGENTDLMVLQGKNGEYKAYIEVKKSGECALTFPHDTTTLKCPKCGGEIIKGSYSYECKECKFSTYHTSFGHEITEEEFNNVAKNMLIGPIPGFTTKEGNSFSAYIVNGGNTYITIRDTIAGRKISTQELLLLLTEGKTGKLSGFKGKSGEFEAGLKLNNKGIVELVFLDDEGKEVKKRAKKSSGKGGYKKGKF